VSNRTDPLEGDVRFMALIGLIFPLMLSACQEYSFGGKDAEEAGVTPGSVRGRVCDTSGRSWLSGAMAYTHLVTAEGKLYDTRIAYTDPDGFFLLEELPAQMEYMVYVQYGDAILDTQNVYVDDAQEVELDEPDCFDPLELDVAIITGDYDNFQLVLQALGFANYDIIDGLYAEEMAAFLLDLDTMKDYDIIFFNGGHVEEGIIYERTVVEEEPEDGDDDGGFVPGGGGGEDDTGEATTDTGTTDTGEDGEPAIVYDSDQIMQNIRDYVEAGGAVYASDWAYDVVEIGWPDALDFLGADEIPDAAQMGEYDVIQAAVSDAALADWLDEDFIEIEYDLPVWPGVLSASERVSTHLAGTIQYREGTTVNTLSAVPLLVSFSSGEGKVAFSTFRVAKNANAEVLLSLQFMMYSL
jgi:hypothetical protein